MEAIFHRISVRKYEDRPVEPEKIERLLRAAMAAPSAHNQQPWEFYVVQDPMICQALAAASPYAQPAAQAPVVVVPCVDVSELRFPECVQQDMSAAIENMLIMATELGLGSLWMGIAPGKERIAHVADVLALAENLVPFALVAFGYPAHIPNPQGAQRYDSKRVHWI